MTKDEFVKKWMRVLRVASQTSFHLRSSHRDDMLADLTALGGRKTKAIKPKDAESQVA